MTTRCPACQGSGCGEDMGACSSCGGEGEIEVVCEECDGTGWLEGYPGLKGAYCACPIGVERSTAWEP